VNDLVEDQQDFVPIAQFAQHGEIFGGGSMMPPVWRSARPSRPHRVGVLHLDHVAMRVAQVMSQSG